MAKPTPKQNFLQTALLMIVIYLGMMLLFNRPQSTDYQGQVLKSPEQVLNAMRDANLKLKDQTIAHRLLPSLQKVVGDAVKAKTLTQAQADDLLIEGAILTADTQLKAGIARNETGRVRAAYQTLVSWENKRLDAPEWNRSVSLPRGVKDADRFEWTSSSGRELYNRAVDTLSQRNKKELIWGFIPGGYQMVDALVNFTGAQPGFSYAFAAFLLALVVRAIVFPLTQKQLMFGRQMSQLVPLTSEIREKYKDRPQEMNMKVMELYREYGINPAAGCLPMLLQFPLFLTVYQCMLLYQFEFQKGTFLWINPVTSKDTNGFIAPNLGQLDFILIIIYGISMVASTLLMPVSDPTQVKQQRLIGVGLSIFVTITMFFGVFPVPAAFVLYWTFTNFLATAQSLRAYRLPMPPLVKVNAPGGGVYPAGAQGKWMKKLEELQRQSEGAKGGSSSGPLNGTIVDPGNTRTGTPAKHKPKKRK